MNKEVDVMSVWDEATEAWIRFVREGKDYYRDWLNNPATLKLIGDVKGKQVLDLACGEGYNTRILARKGARVIGVDFSERMIERAREEEAERPLGITYYFLDATNLEALPSNHFDLATCFMSMQDIENLEEAISEVARALKKKGRFVFSIPHPCFEKLVRDTKGWRWRNKSAAKTDEEKELEEGQYFDNIKYQVHWTMERLTRHFKTISFHRTITDYSQALYQNGFHITRLVEPKPTTEAVSKHPALKKVLKNPQSIIFEAVKVQDGSRQ